MDGDAPTVDGVDSLEDGQLEEEEGEIVREKIGSDISDDELDFGDADGPASPAAGDTSREVYSSDGEILDDPVEEANSVGQRLGGLDTEDISAESAPASPERRGQRIPASHSSRELDSRNDAPKELAVSAPATDSVTANALAPSQQTSNGGAEDEEEEEGMLSDSCEPSAAQENSHDSRVPSSMERDTGQGNVHEPTRKNSKDSHSNFSKVDMKINVQNNKSVGTSKRTVFTVPSDGAKDVDHREKVNGTDRLASSLHRASIHDDHGELDYDEELGDEDVQKKPAKPEEDDEREEGEEVDDPKDGEDDISSNLSSSDGEVDDDDDCEEGEIKEPGDRSPRPFVKPLCRFYTRGHCTWGDNCRFLHPGINDKGNYSLIERPMPSVASGPGRGGQWNDRGDLTARDARFRLKKGGTMPPEELPPPPPEEPPTESAWERGLRQAKELRKLASKRKETDVNFEEKRMTLSMEEDREFNKENDRRPFPKDPYYDNVYEDEDEYYTAKTADQWQRGHFENFEVRWTREPEFEYRRPPQMQPPDEPDPSLRERPHRHRHHHHHHHSSQPQQMGPPPPRGRMLDAMHRMSPPPDRRFERRKERSHPEKIDRMDKFDKPPKVRPMPDDRADDNTTSRPTRGDEWHDPWQRSKNSPKRGGGGGGGGRATRSRSRGRKRYRSSSGSSSSYSSSSSRSSRSRSSSYSSYSSRSSYSGSGSSSYSSRSRSPSPRKNRGPCPARRKQPLAARPLLVRDVPARPLAAKTMQGKLGDPLRSTVAVKGGMRERPGRVPSNMPASAPPGGPPPRIPPSAKPRAPMGELPASAPPGGPMPVRVRKEKKSLRHRRRSSSSGSSSRSRSRSYSSSRSRSRGRSVSSVSSISSSSSNASSGSADSDNLYRDIDTVVSKKNSSPKKKRDKSGGVPKHMDRHRPGAGSRPGRGPPRMGPMSSMGLAIGPTKAAKDPLKVQGQKSNIKLTLISKASADKPTKKRPAPGELNNVPPAKKLVKAIPAKADKMAPMRPDKPVKPAAPKMKPDMPKPGVPPPAKKPAEPPKVVEAPKPAASPQKSKKSTSSRREELLKQLKAVEDAIARKRAKMQ